MTLGPSWIWPPLALSGLALIVYALARLRLAGRGRAGSGRPITRRHAIRLGAAGAGGLLAGSAGWASARGSSGGRLEPAGSGEPLRQPEVLDSRDGTLAVTLVAAPGARLAGRETSAFGYNGSAPGPTLRVRPGDQLAVRLRNSLDAPTNLHTHGLRVSPEGNSDNPFVAVGPGASFEYLFTIPPDHPAGTFWYHPHHHGTAADQQFGGLAGALVVLPAGTAPGADAADVPVDTDLVLLVTDITLRADGSPAPAGGMDVSLGRQGELLLLNGQLRPTLSAAPGSTGRWRIVNACTSRLLALRLDGHRLTQVALDGAFLPAPVDREVVLLAPGNRVDVVVRAGDEGRYDLVAETHDRGRMGMRTTARPPVTLATFDCRGPAVDGPALAAALPAEEPLPAGEADRARQVEFTMRMGMGRMAFHIDDLAFDPDRVDQRVTLGTTEDWFINNDGPLVHPFHLHVWPFVVLASSDGAAPAGVRQDVVNVPARGWTRIRIPFTGHTGRSVFHCHVVDHADEGMMGTVLVEP